MNNVSFGGGEGGSTKKKNVHFVFFLQKKMKNGGWVGGGKPKKISYSARTETLFILILFFILHLLLRQYCVMRIAGKTLGNNVLSLLS